MSEINNKPENTEFNEADSKADTLAIFCLVLIAVGAMVFLANG